ncbi:MAG: hypothetical protein A3I78_03280 [Gammaproteobacteria bacterium RIFCSPLOWO2_02_FULL_56_15]|nr:MAG: hypothetical protein A3I78_03280 [Gammaproteobacteria bacterium RIFCSPLOWO2_02_FULL_56_15]
MTKHIRKTKALIEGILRGLEAPADTFTVNQYPYPHESEHDALRGDWKQVGDEIRSVMANDLA